MSSKRAIFGILLVALGLLFLGRTLDLFYFSAGDLFRIIIPLAIIGLGFWLIVRKRHQEAMSEPKDYSYTYNQESTGSASTQRSSGSSGMGTATASAQAETVGVGAATRTRYSKTFGDIYVDLQGISLENVEVSSTFGDMEITIRGAVLQTGLNRLIVSGFLGDIRVNLPHDLATLVHINSTAGDAEALGKRMSGFGNSIEAQTADYQTADKKLFIAINTFVGDVKVISL